MERAAEHDPAHTARPAASERALTRPGPESTGAAPHRRHSGRTTSPGTVLGDAIAQAKLAVGSADDRFEREADATARRVVRALRTATPVSDENQIDTGPRVQRAAHLTAPVVTDRAETAGHISRIRRSAVVGAQGGELDDDTATLLNRSRSGGAPLPDPARSTMEGAFGADFSNVRVHAGATSTELNNRIQAKAFTTGNDIFFRDGVPDATTGSGQELLAHELTHTIQQGAAGQISRSPGALGLRSDATIQRWGDDTDAEDGYDEVVALLGTMEVEWKKPVPAAARAGLVEALTGLIGSSLKGEALEDFEVAIAEIGEGTSPYEAFETAFLAVNSGMSEERAGTLRDAIDEKIAIVRTQADLDATAAAAAAAAAAVEKAAADKLAGQKTRLGNEAYEGWVKAGLGTADFNTVMSLGAEHDEFLKTLGTTHHAALTTAVGVIGTKAVALWVTGCAGRVDAPTTERFIGIAARLPSKKEAEIGTFFGAVGANLTAVMNAAELFLDAGNSGQHTTERAGGGGSATPVATAHGWTVAKGDIAHYLAGHSYSEYVMTDANASRGTSTMWPAASASAQITTDAKNVVGHADFKDKAATVTAGYENKEVNGYRAGLDANINRVTQMYPRNGTRYSPGVMQSVVRLMRTKG